MAVAITTAVLIVAFCIGAWRLIVWSQDQEAEARAEAAKKTAAEIAVEHSEVLANEQSRSDEEAWNKFNENYPPGDQP